MGRRESARFRRRRQAWWEVQSGATARQAPDEETQREFVTAIDKKRSQAFGIERLARLQLDDPSGLAFAADGVAVEAGAAGCGRDGVVRIWVLDQEGRLDTFIMRHVRAPIAPGQGHSRPLKATVQQLCTLTFKDCESERVI